MNQLQYFNGTDWVNVAEITHLPIVDKKRPTMDIQSFETPLAHMLSAGSEIRLSDANGGEQESIVERVEGNRVYLKRENE